MKILYITTAFDNLESAAVRNNSLVKGLSDLGHIVDVLTIEHPISMTSELFRNCPCNKIIRTKIGVTTFVESQKKKLDWINNSIFRRIKKHLREFLFFPDVYMNWYKLVDDNNYGSYDIIISSSDSKSSHFVALKIKRKFKHIKWIQIWGDPWTLDSTISGFSKIRAKSKEYMLIKAADKVIYVSLITHQAICMKYPNFLDKIKYIPRSYYSEIIRDDNVGEKTNYNILYPGTLSPERNCISFLNSIKKYNEASGVCFTVSFYGNYLKNTLEMLEHFDFVTVHKSVSFEQIQDMYYDTDSFLFISNKKTSTQIPGKLFDFMGANIPIICIVNYQNSELISFLKQFDKCLIFSEDFAAIADQVKNRKFDVEYQFSPRNIANKILNS